MIIRVLILLSILVISCNEPIARKPVTSKGDTFFKESIELNKKLNAEEEEMIKNFIKSDSLTEYITTPYGFWFTYIAKDTLVKQSIKKGDMVNFTYEVNDFNGNNIYPLQEKIYRVDEEILIQGLQDGIKMLKENEEVIFLFPSYNAYGYIGDKKKINGRQTLKYRVKINSIQPLKK
ncbi:MAG: gliding motility-associated peptidyl-prolyl isomerase GldI [Flavobacteriaceae bacterium]|nr:gliding motility-associated peptidyl-prolyl isomerase GldI [Flavobacteriaceae bacterium]